LNLWKKIVKNKTNSSDNLSGKQESSDKKYTSEKSHSISSGNLKEQKPKSFGAGCIFVFWYYYYMTKPTNFYKIFYNEYLQILKFLAFNENNRRILESLNSQNDIPLRNSARKLIYESLLNSTELPCNFI